MGLLSKYVCVHTRVFNGPNPAAFGSFSFLSHDKNSTNLTINDGVFGTQTRGGRMVSADESTEQWQYPKSFKIWSQYVQKIDH